MKVYYLLTLKQSGGPPPITNAAAWPRGHWHNSSSVPWPAYPSPGSHTCQQMLWSGLEKLTVLAISCIPCPACPSFSPHILEEAAACAGRTHGCSSLCLLQEPQCHLLQLMDPAKQVAVVHLPQILIDLTLKHYHDRKLYWNVGIVNIEAA